MKIYLHGQMDYAKKLKLRFRVGDLDLPGKRKRYTSRREEEDVATNMCPRGTTIESIGLTWQKNVKYTRRNGMPLRRGK